LTVRFHFKFVVPEENAEGVELSNGTSKIAELILKVGMLILISPENFMVFGEIDEYHY
jgi:hypothetical protein